MNNRHSLLSCIGLTKRFSGVRALNRVDLDVQIGEIVGLIGPNGSGKTTLCDIITGFCDPDAGGINLAGRNIRRFSAHSRRRLGVGRTFQNLRLFGELTVLENVLIGQHVSFLGRNGSPWGWVAAFLKTAKARRREQEAHDRALKALNLVNLMEKVQARIKTLSYGQRKRVEIARAMALMPRLLVLDEPMAGVSLDDAQIILSLIKEAARSTELGVIFIEHRLDMVTAVCDKVVVLNAGEVVAEGVPDAVFENERVKEAYLGLPPGIDQASI